MSVDMQGLLAMIGSCLLTGGVIVGLAVYGRHQRKKIACDIETRRRAREQQSRRQGINADLELYRKGQEAHRRNR